MKHAESDYAAGTPHKNHSVAVPPAGVIFALARCRSVVPPSSDEPKDVIFALAQLELEETGVSKVRGKRLFTCHAEQKSLGGRAAAFGRAEGRDFRPRAVSGERERACVKYGRDDCSAGTASRSLDLKCEARGERKIAAYAGQFRLDMPEGP